ncbi:MAG: PepSY-associated TM helix domain-containing protein [Thalassotalea sp.]
MFVWVDKLLFKFWLKRGHLFLALISGVFLINIGLSGALLLFAKDIQNFINPQYWLIENPHEHSPQLKPLPLSVLIEKIEDKTKEKISVIELPEQADHVWQAQLSNKMVVNFNPYNADIVLTHRFYDTFYGFIMAWHRWLLYRNSDNETPMQVIVASTAALFILQIMLGFYLWIKPKHRLKRLKINSKAKLKVKLYQLHGSLGVLFTFPLILIAFSGITFYWPQPTKAIVQGLTGSEVEQGNYQYKAGPANTKTEVAVENITSAITTDAANNTNKLDIAYQNGLTSLTNSHVFRIYLPNNKSEVLRLRMQTQTESHANSWVWVNTQTGKVLNVFNAGAASLATRVWNFRYKFHIGEFIAFPIKLLWFCFSLLPIFFVGSGLYMWLKRKRFKSRALS